MLDIGGQEGSSKKRRLLLRRVVRWAITALGLSVVVGGVLLGFACWRFTQGPVDVTALTHCWGPIALHERGDRPSTNYVQWGRVVLEWLPSHEEHPAAITIKLSHIEVKRASGQVVNHVDRAEVVLNVKPLRHKLLALRSVSLSGVSLSLRRQVDGHIILDGGWSPTARASQKTTSQQSSFGWEASALRSVTLRDISISLYNDYRSDDGIFLTIPTADIAYHQPSGWKGTLVGAVSRAHENIPFKLMAIPDQGGVTHLSVAVEPFIPAHWVEGLPKEADVLGRWTMPVWVSVEGEMLPHKMEGHFLNTKAIIHWDSGDILQPGHDALHLREGNAEFKAYWTGPHLLRDLLLDRGTIQFIMQDSQQKLVPVNITTQFHTDSLLALQHIGIDVHAEIPAFDFASLGSIWPQGVMKGGRRWITSNMPVGKGENLTLSAHLQSDHGLKELAVTHLEGDLRGHGLDVFWLRPVQPITGLEAHAHFLDADRLQIDVSHGQIKGDQGVLIRVPQGTTIISGLMHKDQFAHIHVGLNGTLPSFLKLLAHPRLHLLSRHPVPLMKPSGMVLGELSLSLPLDSRVTVNDISFAAKAQCSQIAFGLPALGAIRQGNGLLHVTSKEMHFQGQASLRNVPVQLSMMESFQANVEGRLLRQVDAHALLGPTTWPAFGINIPKGMLMGPVLTNVAYRQVGLGPGHRKADVDLMLDFTQAAVLLPVWSKLSGDSASLTGHIVLLDGALQQLDNVKAKGPGLFLSGTAEIQRHRVHGMVFDHMHVGRNEGRLQIEWPNSLTAHDPYRIDVNALTLDLAPWLKKTSNKKRSGSEVGNKKKSSSWRLPSGKWQVSVQADHVFFDSETAFERVRMAAVWQQYKIQRANLSIVAPYPVTMQLEPRVNGQHLDVSVQNIGDFLKTIGVYSVLSGGSARITGTFLPERLSQQTVGWGIGLGSFEGHLEAQDVAIPHPPAVLTMATVFAPLHWGQLTRDRFEGLSLSSDIMLADEILTLKQTQTHNAMVGGTIEGTVNFKTDALEMKGTVSPFFGLNRAAGSLFGVSSKGKGAMAMNYTLKGTLDHPEFHTYPLSAFLPDVLSNIFH